MLRRPPIAVQSLDHVCVCVSNLPQSIEWYTNVLSLALQHTNAPHFYPTCPHSPAFLAPSNGTATATTTTATTTGVALYELPPSTTPLPHHNGAHFALRVDADTFAHAKHGGLSSLLYRHTPPSSTPTPTSSSDTTRINVDYFNYGLQKSLFFHDPDHNMVELTLWGEEHDNLDLLSLERVRFNTLRELSLRTITPSSSLYTATYNESPFDELPWWGFLWPGGNAICQHLLQHPDLVRGRNVLDFACGGYRPCQCRRSFVVGSFQMVATLQF